MVYNLFPIHRGVVAQDRSALPKVQSIVTRLLPLERPTPHRPASSVPGAYKTFFYAYGYQSTAFFLVDKFPPKGIANCKAPDHGNLGGIPNKRTVKKSRFPYFNVGPNVSRHLVSSGVSNRHAVRQL